MKKNLEKGGIISVIALLALGILIFLSAYFLSFVLSESKISRSQEAATKTYYLAEAGINEAIWKLKNDDTITDGDDPWEICFVSSTEACDCNYWTDTFIKNTDFLLPNSTTVVSIENSECARGEIIATSTLTLPNGKTAQRIVKTTVFKSLASPTKGSAVFSGGTSEDITIDSSKIKIFGNLFSNNNLIIRYQSQVDVYDNLDTEEEEGKVLVVNNLNLKNSTVSSTAMCAKNICNTTSTCVCTDTEKFQTCEENSCPPRPISVPIVDFDSFASTSFKTRAQTAQDAGLCQNLCNGAPCYCDGVPCSGNNKCVLDSNEFEDLLWAAGEGGTLILNSTSLPGIVYVEGPIEIRGGRHLIVNGALVADDTINIGEGYKWTKGGQTDEGFSQITINRPTATTTSGLLTKRKINFGQYSSFTTTTIIGAIYANDEIRLTSLPKSFTLRGGIIGRKLSFNSVWHWFNFILDNEIMLYGLGYKINNQTIEPLYSPIITIEHWEESY